MCFWIIDILLRLFYTNVSVLDVFFTDNSYNFVTKLGVIYVIKLKVPQASFLFIIVYYLVDLALLDYYRKRIKGIQL